MTASADRMRPLALVVALAVGAALAWPVVVQGLAADAVLRGQGEAALATDAGDPAGATLAAEARLARGDTAGAEAAGMAAVAGLPVSAAALRAVAFSHLQDEPDRAAQMLSYGAALGWRDHATQQWLAAAAAAAGDATGAASRIDALARVDGMTPPVPALLDALAATTAGRAALAARMALAPAWRRDYFAAPVAGDAALAGRAGLFAALSSTAAPAAPHEIAGLTNTLVAAGDYGAAAQVWRAAMPAAGVPNDGGFAHIPHERGDVSPFDWRLSAPPGGAAEAGDVPGAPAGLHLASDGTVSGAMASQTLVLAPGGYTLFSTARFQGPLARTGFRWAITCLPSGTRTMLPPAAADTGTAALPFAIPAGDGCRAQTLALRAVPIGSDAIEAQIASVAIR